MPFSLIDRRYSHLDKGARAAQDKPVSALVVRGWLTRVITAFWQPVPLRTGYFLSALLSMLRLRSRAGCGLSHALGIEQFQLPWLRGCGPFERQQRGLAL